MCSHFWKASGHRGPIVPRSLRKSCLGLLFVTLGVLAGQPANGSEIATLAAEIGRTSVMLHHRCLNPARIKATEIHVNHQGDITHFRALMVWSTGRWHPTWHRAAVYGSLVNRADLRRLVDIDYTEGADIPWLCHDHAPEVLSYWNTRFSRDDTLLPLREIGQPLDGSMNASPDCEILTDHELGIVPQNEDGLDANHLPPMPEAADGHDFSAEGRPVPPDAPTPERFPVPHREGRASERAVRKVTMQFRERAKSPIPSRGQ